jgi:hypothetical protein
MPPIFNEILALPGLVKHRVLCWVFTRIGIPQFLHAPWSKLTLREKRIRLHHWAPHNLPWQLPEESSHPDLLALVRVRGGQSINILH